VGVGAAACVDATLALHGAELAGHIGSRREEGETRVGDVGGSIASLRGRRGACAAQERTGIGQRWIRVTEE
jgi:hypothetical protein